MGVVLWDTMSEDTTQVILTKENNETVTLRVGDFITYEGRPDGVRIEGFTGQRTEEGPIGMTYLPWKKEESRWATVAWSLRGNVRHIIAHPCGMMKYGEHIVWDTVELLNGGVCPIVPHAPPPDASEVPQ